ncbi:HAD family acid phosphatase [Pseudolysinimonas sp.]|uniref:HAD family acid phosphatase n=1 Tax=Pseudolysinimonas sp. TaxID=2680009 RepID=UPI003F7EF90C
MSKRPLRAALVGVATAALAAGALFAGTAPATASPTSQANFGHDSSLTPRTQFTMAPDGSSGATQGGEGIPNIDVVKKTIAAYYGDPGTGIANKTSSPYIAEMSGIAQKLTAELPALYAQAAATGKKPAIVLDTDDTMLMTYDREVAAMHFNFDPALNNQDVLNEVFPATPAMPAFVKAAQNAGFAIFGITGRSAAQQQASIENVAKVGYTGFTTDNYFTKWAPGAQPSYVTCATATCTTVEYKANTRKHIEQDLGYEIALNVGDQFSDLQGGYTEQNQKLPNPTYYLPSPDLPGVDEPQLAPRTHFEMKADGSSGTTQGGEGIPNIDSVKKTIATYYGDPGTGIANKISSPYISEMQRIQRQNLAKISALCFVGKKLHQKPAVIFDTDDTMLETYDREVSVMHFNFDPAQNNQDVLNEVFPATPGMVGFENAVKAAGCTPIGITGRSDAQKAASIENVTKVGYEGFGSSNYFTKFPAGQKPAYLNCAAGATCTTIEYKSGTRAYLETKAGGKYRIIANLGDQYSDLIGGHAFFDVKLPNPTYYLP